jgi:hypothetical protein
MTRRQPTGYGWRIWWSARPALHTRPPLHARRPKENTMTPAIHPCPAPQCKIRDLPARLLMCAQHWAMVPSPLQRAVYLAYDHGRGVGTIALLRAQTEALSAVDTALGFPGLNFAKGDHRA